MSKIYRVQHKNKPGKYFDELPRIGETIVATFLDEVQMKGSVQRIDKDGVGEYFFVDEENTERRSPYSLLTYKYVEQAHV